MPELISSIDNFAKGLTAPIHRPRARRGCPHHRGLPEGPPSPAQHIRVSAKALTASQKSKICYYPAVEQ